MSGWTYNAAGPQIAAFLQSQAFVRGLMGPVGSGKSTACVMDIISKAREQKKGPTGKASTRWAIIRNTYPELKTTTIKTWQQWVPPTLGRWQSEGPPTHFVETSDMSMEVMFVALDRPEDVRKLLSMELTGGWINEAREVPRTILDGLTGRVGRFPPMRDGGATWSGVIMDTNPPDMDHWYYKLAEDEKPKDFEFFRQPSGMLTTAENLGNLPPDYYPRLISGKSEDWIKVYVRGDYGFVTDGKPVYDQFHDHLHVVECEYIPSWPLHIGMDFGLTPAAVFAQRSPMGQTRCLSEIVATRLGARAFGREIREHLAENYPGAKLGTITGDPSGDGGGNDETTAFQLLAAEGVLALPASTNDIAIRIEAVNGPMRSLIDGRPALVLHPRCKQLRKACAGGYQYRRVQLSSELRFEQKPNKNMSSHIAEALQYLELGLGAGREVVARPAQLTPGHDGRAQFATGTGEIKGW